MKFIEILRPSHWTNNLFIFAALIFGKKLFGPANEVFLAIASSIGAFFCFSMAASAVYIFNDMIDRPVDKLHPEKSKRPIAAGQVSIPLASAMAIICAVIAFAGSLMLSFRFTEIIVAYMVLMVLYTVIFKKLMILDCIVIAIGFCLRAVSGSVVIGVYISPWLIICTFALCLFMGFGKRRSEFALTGADYPSVISAGYTPELLAHMLDVTSVLAIVSFLLYAMAERTIKNFGTSNIVYTTPMVLYCIFRFSALIQRGRYSGPIGLILHDKPFQISFFLWVLACIAIIYTRNIFGNPWAY